MTPAYLVATLRIDDQETYQKYLEAAMISLEPYESAEVLVLADNPEFVEGEGEFSRVVIIKFPERTLLDAWWNSDAYRMAAPIRHAASSHTTGVIVEGYVAFNELFQSKLEPTRAKHRPS